MDLRHAAVLAVAQRPDQGDDVEAELVLRQRDGALGLRPVGPVMAGAARVSQRRIFRRRRTRPVSVVTVRRFS